MSMILWKLPFGSLALFFSLPLYAFVLTLPSNTSKLERYPHNTSNPLTVPPSPLIITPWPAIPFEFHYNHPKSHEDRTLRVNWIKKLTYPPSAAVITDHLRRFANLMLRSGITEYEDYVFENLHISLWLEGEYDTPRRRHIFLTVIYHVIRLFEDHPPVWLGSQYKSRQFGEPILALFELTF